MSDQKCFIDHDLFVIHLKQAKAERGLSWSDVCNETGLHKSKVSRFINGKLEHISAEDFLTLCLWMGFKLELPFVLSPANAREMSDLDFHIINLRSTIAFLKSM